jgi:AcrR family transcriptional regulator
VLGVPATLPGTLTPRVLGRCVPRGRHGRGRAEIDAVQRARLIDAIVQVVDEAGIDEAGVAAVCKRAGISTREFYVLFSNKEECLLAALTTGAHAVCVEGRRAYVEADGPWEQRVAEALRAILQDLAANPAFAQFSLLEMPRASAQVVERFNDLICEFEKVFFEDAVPEFGETPGLGPCGLESVLIGGAMERMARCVRDSGGGDLMSVLPEVTYFLTAFVVGHERALRAAERARSFAN